MVMMSWSDLYPEVKMVSRDDVEAFVTTWFNKGDLIRLTYMKGTKQVSESVRAYEVSTITNAELNQMTAEDVNVYFTVQPTLEVISDPHKRGGTENCKSIRGLFADIDCKPGSFSSQQEILDFLDSLEAKPTMVVGSGSGGVHAYWKLSQDIDPGRRGIQEMWWTYLQERAGERIIDKLTDSCSRMLRLPGTVRFKRNDDPAPVRLLKNTGETHDYEKLFSLSEAASRSYKQRRAVTRKVDEAIESRLTKHVEQFGGRFLLVAQLDEYINENYDWADILEPYGYELTNTDQEGTRQWQRPGPGASKRSATTDWEESPHVLSLLSTAHETGLADLHEAEIPLTKQRCLLRLRYNDDYKAMVDGVLADMTN